MLSSWQSIYFEALDVIYPTMGFHRSRYSHDWRFYGVDLDAAKNANDANMDNSREHGDPFTIPDLWASSRCIEHDQGHSNLLFSQLTLNGMSHNTQALI